MYVALMFVCWTESELSDHLLSCLKVNCRLCFFSVQPTFGQPVTYFQHCCWSFDDDGPVNGDDDNFTVRSLSWWFCSKGFGFCLSEPPRRNYLEKEQKKVVKTTTTTTLPSHQRWPVMRVSSLTRTASVSWCLVSARSSALICRPARGFGAPHQRGRWSDVGDDDDDHGDYYDYYDNEVKENVFFKLTRRTCSILKFEYRRMVVKPNTCHGQMEPLVEKVSR